MLIPDALKPLLHLLLLHPLAIVPLALIETVVTFITTDLEALFQVVSHKNMFPLIFIKITLPTITTSYHSF